jgi:hypothetical protein
MIERHPLRAPALVAVALSASLPAASLLAHHSFAMYDRSTQYLFTGVVDSINPDPAHLQIVFVPLNEARDALVRNAAGERVAWTVEMEGAAASAREGISASAFSRGTVFSVGLTPLRNGNPGGVRVQGIYKCPQGTAPAAGKHCDSVQGSTHHGEGALSSPNKTWTP